MKGGDVLLAGGGGEGEKDGVDCSVARMDSREGGESQGGGRMLARR